MDTLTLNQAARAFTKLWNAKSRANQKAEVADAAFDAGEFSGPAHWRKQVDDYESLMDHVAVRTGYTESQILDEIHRQDAEYLYRSSVRH